MMQAAFFYSCMKRKETHGDFGVWDYNIIRTIVIKKKEGSANIVLNPSRKHSGIYICFLIYYGTFSHWLLLGRQPQELVATDRGML